ncbi:MAG: hypothetical protein CMJ67_00710 [Planctomycetaceae bacterium]|nr:hypothetical protein [Planctomycetaceae bacterium]
MLVFGAVFAAVAGCSSQDPVGVRVNLAQAGSGTIAIAALSLPEISKEVANQSKGIDWSMDARLNVTTGTFASLDGVTIEDLRIRSKDFGEDGSGTIRISMPCGEKAKWFRSLHASPSDRGVLRKTLEQSINEIELHENVTIAVEVEGARVAGSLVQPIPRVSVGSKDDTCTLVVPLEILESRKEPLVLVLNWERPTQTATR